MQPDEAPLIELLDADIASMSNEELRAHYERLQITTASAPSRAKATRKKQSEGEKQMDKAKIDIDNFL